MKIRNLAYTLLCAGAALAGCATAPGERTISTTEMANARSAASTPFQRCLTQSGLVAKGYDLDDDALKVAKAAQGYSATNNYVQALGLVPKQSAGLMTAFSGDEADVGNGLGFKLGYGYAADAQGWYQSLNEGDVQRAAMLLAYDRSGLLLPQEEGAAPQQKLASMTSSFSLAKLRGKGDEDASSEAEPPQAAEAPQPAEVAVVQLTDEQIAGHLELLEFLERGTLSLSMGDADCAVRFLDYAQTASEGEEGRYFGKTLKGYEHIMMLNKKSMAYLMAGDVRARNIAIASRELQSKVREEYEAEIEARLAEAKSGEDAAFLQSNPGLIDMVTSSFMQSSLQNNVAVAEQVTTPYVNPLADYLSAVVAEAEASAGIGRRDNWDMASIAWANSAKLAPQASFLDEAAADARRRKNGAGNTKVVNVLVGMGSAPHKVVASLDIDMENGTMPFMIPVMTRTPSSLAGGTVSAGSSARQLELVSNVEAMALRHAQDEMVAEVVAGLVRGYLAYKAGNAAGANSGNVATEFLGSMVSDAIAEPPTDGWMSLPRAYYATRLVVPANQDSVAVSVKSANGNVMTRNYPLLDDQATFVHVMARDGGMWGAAQTAPIGQSSIDFAAR